MQVVEISELVRNGLETESPHCPAHVPYTQAKTQDCFLSIPIVTPLARGPQNLTSPPLCFHFAAFGIQGDLPKTQG